MATPACVSAAPICCIRLIRSIAAAGGSTKRQAGYRRPVIGELGLMSSKRVDAELDAHCLPAVMDADA